MKNAMKFILFLFGLTIFTGQAEIFNETVPCSLEAIEAETRLIEGSNRFNQNRHAKKNNSHHLALQPTTKTPRAKAEWTIVILVQASNNLESFAHKNMKEMMRWGSSARVNLLVDLHKTGDKSWKYRIEQGCCVIEEVSARTTKSTIAEEVIHTANWAVTNYPAEHYAFIFWNHGYGCLDPVQERNRPAYLRNMNNNWRTGYLTGNSEEGLSRATKNSIPTDRSILFDDERHTYLSNEELRNTLQTISTKFLGGKKIDLIGMDACLMGMIEVADQLKDFAHYFVASEEFEFAQGWPYGDIIERLSTKQTSAKDLGKIIVEAYEQYYLSRTSYFTQSCVDLSKISTIKEHIDNLVTLLMAAKKQDPQRMKIFIQQAKFQALSFSLSDYIDLQSFYQELLKNVNCVLDNQSNRNMAIPRIDNELLRKIKVSLTDGLTAIKNTITINTAGRYLARASGMSIYFPQRSIDSSYGTNEFAKTTLWPVLIADQIENRY